MNAPPLLLAAGLVFWSQQTGYWLLAGLLAAILEGARLLDRRWELARSDFFRIGDLSTVFFLATVVYLVMTKGMIQAWPLVLCWIPISLFPVIAAQALSVQGRLDLGALFWSLRGSVAASSRTIDVSYPYFALCVLSAGAANRRTPTYFAGMFALCAWSLWRFRAPAVPLWRWAALVLLAGILGFAGAAGLANLQVALERSALNAVFGNGEVPMDPYQTRMAMGRIGTIQQNGGIALRVRAEGRPPSLLRTASYNHYSNAQWFAREPGFRPLTAGKSPASWELSAAASAAAELTVSAYWPQGAGVLSLPQHAARIDGLYAGSIGGNRLGAVKVVEAPTAVVYRVAAAPEASRDSPPDAFDLEVPAAEAKVFKDLARELRLDAKAPGPAAAAAAAYFRRNFRYTIYQKRASDRPLTDFLLKDRTGHCEYFATSAVLLLRAAGIPARYATGYAVSEPGRGEFVVRQRDAHAWALAYVDGDWREVEATPATWGQAEQSRASWLEPLDDLAWSARLRLGLWRSALSKAGEKRGGPAFWLLLAALAGWIVWKAAALIKASNRAGAPAALAAVARRSDSEFYAIEESLGRSGLGRLPWESASSWVERVSKGVVSAKVESLRALLALHYRYRFDPRGLTAGEREELRSGVRDWLALDESPARG